MFVITPNAGLRSPDTSISLDAIRGFAGVDVSIDNPKYRRPSSGAHARSRRHRPDCPVVLLGSIASPKYVDVLQAIFGDRLLFPDAFVGRGDMSRGGLLLRCAAAGEELSYVPVAGAVRHGVRPARLDPATRVKMPQASRPEGLHYYNGRLKLPYDGSAGAAHAGLIRWRAAEQCRAAKNGADRPLTVYELVRTPVSRASLRIPPSTFIWLPHCHGSNYV